MAVFGFELPVLLMLIGLGLMIAEAMSPGAHLIVLGVALLFAGMLGVVVTPLASPIALAGTTLAIGAVALFVYREYDLYGGTTAQTSSSDSLRGATGRVLDRVTETDGRVKLDDGGFNPIYQARAVDRTIEEGEEIIVVDPGGGNVVTVTALDGLEDDQIDRELARESDDGTGDEPVGEPESASGA
ncbi:NfeD family protein [Salinarchaeum laminariae]|mgnify:CR=1 FL=1|uniref:NfeD family protein n=1 Tax=Salinarchaeum laminariae TaxID=869888 RepID=UPI0020BF6732|nr:NfeD family protein [Salinarchaeum laminariae]